MPETHVFVRDRQLRIQGELEDYRELKMVLRYSDVSSWDLAVDEASEAADALTHEAGWGLLVVRDGVTLLSGDVEAPVETLSGDELALRMTGRDDTQVLADRLALPAPSGDLSSADYHVLAGPAETVLLGYVAANCASEEAAGAGRSTRGLVVPPSLGRGLRVRYEARLESLLEVCQSVALRGGDLGFRVVQHERALQLVVTAPRDRRGQAQFSRSLGNLDGYTLERERPTANVALVAGGGELRDRLFVTVVNRASLAAGDPRREVLVDQRQSTDPEVLRQAGEEELAKHSGTSAAKLQPLDTDGVAYRREWDLGDLVRVQGLASSVREVVLTLTPDGEHVEPLLGGAAAVDPTGLRIFRDRRQTASRVSNLERR